MSRPKYALPEIERRWLVARELAQPLLHVYEIEFDALDAAIRYTPPAFVGQEITDDPNYSGLMLARQFQ